MEVEEQAEQIETDQKGKNQGQKIQTQFERQENSYSREFSACRYKFESQESYTFTETIQKQRVNDEETHKINKIDSTRKYPVRARINPVKYWLKEKAVYRKGQIYAIRNSTIDLGTLLGMKASNYPFLQITQNLKNRRIEAKLAIPQGKDTKLLFQGFSSPYYQLTISPNISAVSKQSSTIYLETSERLSILKEQEEDWIVIQQNFGFSLWNSSNAKSVINLFLYY